VTSSEQDSKSSRRAAGRQVDFEGRRALIARRAGTALVPAHLDDTAVADGFSDPQGKLLQAVAYALQTPLAVQEALELQVSIAPPQDFTGAEHRRCPVRALQHEALVGRAFVHHFSRSLRLHVP
jgi:hypothetical protein